MGALRAIEGGMDRALQAEIQVLAAEEWPTFCRLRERSDDERYASIDAQERADGFTQMFDYRGWSVAVRAQLAAPC